MESGGVARSIDPTAAQTVLEAAAREARTHPRPGNRVQKLWEVRVRIAWDWTSSKTAVAAIGTALLAKAVDPRVDPLSLKPSSGANGYSARSLASKVLAAHRQTYGYVLGTGASDPLANSPWYEPNRIDRITKWKNPEVGVELVSWLSGLSQAEAREGLVAFLRIAMEQARERAASAAGTRAAVGAVDTLEQLIDGVTLLGTLDAEDGRIGAAATAAAFAAAGYRVAARVVNDPGQTDVDVLQPRGELPFLGIEVKQKVATEQDARDICEGAKAVGATKALLAALHPSQPALDRDGLARWADEEIGVALAIAHGFREMLNVALHSSAVTRTGFLDRYAGEMSEWLVALEASDAGCQRWTVMVDRWRQDAAEASTA